MCSIHKSVAEWLSEYNVHKTVLYANGLIQCGKLP